MSEMEQKGLGWLTWSRNGTHHSKTFVAELGEPARSYEVWISFV